MRRRNVKRPGTVARKLMRHCGVSDAELAMRALASDLVVRADESLPPYDLVALAGILGAQGVETCDLDVDGDLFERDGQLIVRLDAAAPLGRRRFTLAHEIGHLLLVPVAGFPKDSSACGEDRELERLCDVAATELLLPESHVSAYFSNHPRSARSIVHLAEQFQVSIQAASIRTVELMPWCYCVGFAEVVHSKSRLQVAWSFGDHRESLDDPDIAVVAARSCQSGDVGTWNSFVGFGGTARRVNVQVVPIGSKSRVLILLRSPIVT
jgi:hypothetical protein